MSSTANLALVKKELRQTLRGHGALVLENLYLLAVGGVAVYGCFTYSAFRSPSWLAGAGSFWLLVVVQAVLAVVFGAAITAPSVTVEGEQKTYDILASTPLVERQIVWGKLLAAFLAGAVPLVVSAPVAAGLFLMGGVPLASAIGAYLILFGSLALGVALGLHCSVAVGRTAAAVPMAVTGALGISFVFAAFSRSAPALAAFSPLAGVKQLASAYPVALANLRVPVAIVSLALWALAAFTLAERSVQSLTPPSLRRLWGVRWRFAALLFLMALATVGSLKLARDTAAACAGPACVRGTPDQIDRQAFQLGEYAFGCAIVLPFVFLPLFAAGAASPLDKRRDTGESLEGYGLWERLFGFSIQSGWRYVLLLSVVALLAGELGLALWGRAILARWWSNMALAFVPIFAALWVFGTVADWLGPAKAARSDLGRKLVLFLIACVVLWASCMPALMLWGDLKEPSSAGELASTMILPLGSFAAFPSSKLPWASPFMQSLSESVPVPVITAGWYVVAGVALQVLRALVRRRRRGKQD